jgi:hypothetical protein
METKVLVDKKIDIRTNNWLPFVVDQIVEHAKDKRSIIMCDMVDKIEVIASLLKEKGITCEPILSTHTLHVQQLAKRLINDGVLQAIITDSVIHTIAIQQYAIGVVLSVIEHEKDIYRFSISEHDFQLKSKTPSPWIEVEDVIYSKKEKHSITVPIWDESLQQYTPKIIHFPATLVVKYLLFNHFTLSVSEYVPLEDKQQRYFDVESWLDKRFFNDTLLSLNPSDIKVDDILSGAIKLKKPKRILTSFIKETERQRVIDYEF